PHAKPSYRPRGKGRTRYSSASFVTSITKGGIKMDPLTAALLLVGTIYSTSQANKRDREARKLAKEQMKREQELAKPTAEQAAKYNQLVNQLSYIAGIDPTNMFLTEGLRGGATIDAPEVRQGKFDVIPDEVLDAVISNAQSDIMEQLGRSQERVLENLARRGLAGSSVVDERQAF